MPSRALLAGRAPRHARRARADNGVGLTPAMGWNSWNAFRCDINENLIRQVARALVDSGLRDAGYKYVNIDDCWMHKRGADGHIIPFKDKFPSGMRALGDYIHSLGLKFGIYSDTGNTTCEGYPGSYGHEAIDAADYASWGVDYLKYDYCGMERARHPPKHYYALMRDALNATGRPVLFSLCNWGTASPWSGVPPSATRGARVATCLRSGPSTTRARSRAARLPPVVHDRGGGRCAPTRRPPAPVSSTTPTCSSSASRA